MSLADELAKVSVAAHVKQADDLTGVRDEFENSALNERVLRRHAQRLEELAAQRASKEDQTPGGYAETLAKRLMPVPHTAGEAAVRLPGMIAGGIAGHEFGKSFEPLAAEGLERVFSPMNAGTDQTVMVPLAERLHRLGADPLRTTEFLDKHLVTPGEDLASAFRRPLPFSKPTAIRQELQGLIGEEKIPQFQKVLGNLIRQHGPAEKVAPALSKYRVGGAIGGALLGGAALGLPFAARALWQKHQGGEAAVRARNQAKDTMGKADTEFQHREDLLNKLPPTKEASAMGSLQKAFSTPGMGSEVLKNGLAGAASGAVAGGARELLAGAPQKTGYDKLKEVLRQSLLGGATGGAGGAALGAARSSFGSPKQ